MTITPGSRFGVYEITAQIGEGGMGQVFRAIDTRLKRQVAIKILPPSLAGSEERLARFQREAEVLASLNHPHIAALYGLAESDGASALVMELVEGEDLSQRIARGAMPLDEALPIAKQIAEALEAAHEQGIVHRDLKPANIKLRADGTVKVLDFGLAKALDPTGVMSMAVSMSPAITSPAMTQAGIILGTAAYMSPEQAKGRSVDRRADVWAFGIVLYEMLVGRRLFDREDVSETLAAVLTSEPDLAALPERTPAAIRRLLQRCLVKDQRQRLDSMTAVRLDIDEVLRSPAAPTDIARRAGVSPLAAVALIAVSLALGAVAMRMVSTQRSAATALPTVAQIGAPPGVISAFHDGFALSPDGSVLAFAARDTSGTRQIWIRRLDETIARPLDGTTNGTYPFWSPDGGHVAFFVNGMLRRVPADGGSAQTVCPAIGIFPSGSWSDRDEIVFSVRTQASRPIFKVSATGGTPAPMNLDGGSLQWLPGGRQFLFASDSGDPAVKVASSDGGTPRTIVPLEAGLEGRRFFYAQSGRLFANRGDALTVQRIDPATLTAVGSPVAITGPAGTPKNWLAVSAAANAVVALAGPRLSAGNFGDPVARLRWVDRRGTSVGDEGESDRYWALRLAPDGRRIAVNADEHVRILARGMRPVRIPQEGYGPVWSPDGSQIALQEPGGARIRFVDRDGPFIAITDVLTDDDVTDWSADGRRLLATRNATPSTPSRDIVVFDVATRTTTPWVATAANEQHGRFSPDGRHVAYTSDASGEDEVYIREFEGNASAVSVGKGTHPSWRRDGRELFYLGPNDEMMAVEMTTTGQPASMPQQLFRIPLNDITRSFVSPYDVAPDGQRFLLNVPETPTPLLYIRGLEQWLDRSRELR